jgi:uncharacterized membrane protein YuzA (DUF378 family)
MCKGCCKGSCTLAMIAKILVIIGGINWGLIGLGLLLGSMSNWNVVNMIVGSIPPVEAIVYVLVGISAIVLIFGCKCGKCADVSPVNTGVNMGGSM